MSLRYDFDISSVFDQDLFADPGARAMFEDIGEEDDLGGNRLALFRDPVTVEALEAAPLGLRAYLQASGFGLTPSDSSLAPGTYRDSDEEARLQVLERLAGNLGKYDLTGRSGTAYDTRFNMADFVAALDSAQPATEDVASQPVTPGPAEEIAQKASVASRVRTLLRWRPERLRFPKIFISRANTLIAASIAVAALVVFSVLFAIQIISPLWGVQTASGL